MAAKWLTRVAASSSTSTDRTKARLAVSDMAGARSGFRFHSSPPRRLAQVPPVRRTVGTSAYHEHMSERHDVLIVGGGVFQIFFSTKKDHLAIEESAEGMAGMH